MIKRIGSIRFTSYAMTTSCAVAVVHALAVEDLASFLMPAPVYGYALLLAVVCTLLPIFMIGEAIRRAGANLTALAGTLGPVATIAMAAIFLGEYIVPQQLAGIALVIAGVALVSWRAVAK